MSNVEQMADNLSYMRDFKPLSDSEREVIRQAQKALQEVETIPCTACRYCVKGCPMSIEIPAIFKAENEILKYNRISAAKNMYKRATQEGGKATDCIACGQCEGACPQRLEIIDLLKKCVEDLETA
jgi:predicted aldo/keto reductase-like oxidoreductase